MVVAGGHARAASLFVGRAARGVLLFGAHLAVRGKRRPRSTGAESLPQWTFTEQRPAHQTAHFEPGFGRGVAAENAKLSNDHKAGCGRRDRIDRAAGVGVKLIAAPAVDHQERNIQLRHAA